MTDYTKLTNFSVKDTLASGNPAKVIRGAEFDAEFNNIETAVNAKADVAELATEIQDRQAADQALEGSIDAEMAARISADNTLQGNIDSEEASRISADTTLQGNIDAEVSARQAADDTLQGNIDAETASRIAADSTLQDAIDAEMAARIAADDTLQGNIDSEASARQTADTALQSNIDLKADIDSPVFTGLPIVSQAAPDPSNIFAGLRLKHLTLPDGQPRIAFLDVSNSNDNLVSDITSVSFNDGASAWSLRTSTAGDSTVDRRVERLRINKAGYLKADPSGNFINAFNGGVNIEAPRHEMFESSNDVAVLETHHTGSSCIGISSIIAGNSVGRIYTGLRGQSVVFNVLETGTTENGTGVYTQIGSDRRIKENITEATPQLDDVMKLRFVNFNYKQDFLDNPDKQFGLIAQEVEEIFPNLVFENSSEYEGETVKNYKASILAQIAIKALQELKTEKDELAVEHESLKDQVRLLTERIEAIEANN